MGLKEQNNKLSAMLII